MSGNFRTEGKVYELIDLLTWPNIKEGKKYTFCFKIFVGMSDEWDALFVFKLFISFFYVSKRHCFKRKAKIAFFEDCFDTWMILVFLYCD